MHNQLFAVGAVAVFNLFEYLVLLLFSKRRRKSLRAVDIKKLAFGSDKYHKAAFEPEETEFKL